MHAKLSSRARQRFRHDCDSRLQSPQSISNRDRHVMSAMFFEMLKLLAIDAGVRRPVLALLLVPLAQYKKAAFAVLKRNFVGYFSNPTGYVFLCLFVLLTSAAAFWPHEFFIANLANLDQLNKYMPLILLVFVPAITMSIWADERRQGTDELLLTLPAADFDIVIGKYLAAAAIFTVSLLFSQLANYSVLVLAGDRPGHELVDIDTGLFFTTYFGYWLMGLAMLSIGMVASFLTQQPDGQLHPGHAVQRDPGGDVLRRRARPGQPRWPSRFRSGALPRSSTISAAASSASRRPRSSC